MNYFLQLNKSLVLVSTLLLLMFTIFFIFIKKNFIDLENNKQSYIINNNSTYDIISPKFTINNKNKKIFVTADHGN